MGFKDNVFLNQGNGEKEFIPSIKNVSFFKNNVRKNKKEKSEAFNPES
jgi:hypothetical protein